MAQILVRNLTARAVKRLKEQAARRGRSLQSEVKEILEREAATTKLTGAEAMDFALRISKRFRPGRSPDAAQLIREDRDR